MTLDLAIIGGVLSGLALARATQDAGLETHLFEARNRLGGRIHGVQGVDLGPSWFWPGHSRIAALCEELNVDVIEQWASGDALFEDGQSVQRGQGIGSMAGTFRVAGGLSALVEALAAKLDLNRVSLGAKVTQIARTEGGIRVDIADGASVLAKRVVLAIPPRLAPALIPELPASVLTALQGIPGWMAGQAKIVAVYERPFWRDAGLSGDAASRIGPMVEMHDATDPVTGRGALFGFVGILAPSRDGQADAVRASALAQLERLFGPQAATPEALVLQDWAQEPFTAARRDWDFNGPHPRYGCPPALKTLWDGALAFGSTEFAATQGGFLEGALERAEELLSQMASNSPRA